VYQQFWTIPKGDSPLLLKDFLQAYLLEGGAYYSLKNFSEPQATYAFRYSNTGYALLGLIVETVSGQSFEDYCQQHIFQALGMKHSSWFLSELAEQGVAKPYVKQDDGKLLFKGHNGYPDYPAGQLRSSVADFSTLIAAYLNAEEQPFFLKSDIVQLISPNPTYAQSGFHTWYLVGAGENIYYAHEGGDTGVNTIVLMDVKNKNAIIIFANTNYRFKTLWRKIEALAFG